MPQTRYGIPVWLARVPRKRRPSYPRLRRYQEAEVAVIGAGMAGCATAYAFAASGVSVALVEAEAIGQGATASSTGLLMQELDGDYLELEAQYGRRAARRIWQMTRRANLDLVATLRRLRIRCQLETHDALYFARSEDDATLLRRELAGRRTAGLEATWLTPDRLHWATKLRGHGGIRTRGNSQVDPYRACLGLAVAAAKRGAEVYERSPVTKIRPDRGGVDIKTDGGMLRAQQVVITTGTASALFKPLARHFRATHSYNVLTPPLGAKVRAELGQRDAILRNTEVPPHRFRWTRDDRVMFGGAAQPEPPSRRWEKILVQRAGQLMYELSTHYPVVSGIQPEYAWATPITMTTDALPYVGPHRNYPRHLFALGLGHNSLTAAFLSSRVLLRCYLGAPSKGDELLGFTR